MPSSSQCPFLDFSLEIRERIYEFVIEAWDEEETIFGKPCITMEESQRMNTTFPLFQVSRQIRFEAMNTHYRSISVAIYRGAGNSFVKEDQEIRCWLESFRDNVGSLRHLVLKALKLGDLPDYLDKDWIGKVWRYRCHVDIASGTLKYSVRNCKGVEFSKGQRQRLRQNMDTALRVIRSKREEGTLNQEHLRLFFDTFFSSFPKLGTGEKYTYIESSLDFERWTPLDALLVSV